MLRFTYIVSQYDLTTEAKHFRIFGSSLYFITKNTANAVFILFEQGRLRDQEILP